MCKWPLWPMYLAHIETHVQLLYYLPFQGLEEYTNRSLLQKRIVLVTSSISLLFVVSRPNYACLKVVMILIRPYAGFIQLSDKRFACKRFACHGESRTKALQLVGRAPAPVLLLLCNYDQRRTSVLESLNQLFLVVLILGLKMFIYHNPVRIQALGAE